jgi:DNA replication protein DnaC
MVPCDACGIVRQHRIARFDRYSSRTGAARGQRFSTFASDGPASAACEAFNAAVDFAAQPHGWLVIHGPMGNGKSHLAAAIANHLIDARRIPTLFLTAPELLEALRHEIQHAVDAGSGPHASLLHAARTVPVLILDDLGAERTTGWAEERLFLLLDKRYREQSPTVIITNELLENLPPRIYSRLGDRNLSTVVYNPAADYRWGQGRVTPQRRQGPGTR